MRTPSISAQLHAACRAAAKCSSCATVARWTDKTSTIADLVARMPPSALHLRTHLCLACVAKVRGILQPRSETCLQCGGPTTSPVPGVRRCARCLDA